MHRLGDSLGAELGTLNELRALHQHLTETSGKLSTAHAALVSVLGGKNIPYDGSRQKLEQLGSFTDLVLDAPEEHFHLQTPGLTRDGAVQALEQLVALQSEWTILEKDLGESLYVDTCRMKATSNKPFLPLREGDAWYRFSKPLAQGSGPAQGATTYKAEDAWPKEAEQLEQIIKLLSLKEQWKASPTWVQFLGSPAPVTPMPLEGYLALARWNRAIKVASEDIQAVLIDPITFTADQARALRREFSSVKLEITAALTAFKVSTRSSNGSPSSVEVI